MGFVTVTTSTYEQSVRRPTLFDKAQEDEDTIWELDRHHVFLEAQTQLFLLQIYSNACFDPEDNCQVFYKMGEAS